MAAVLVVACSPLHAVADARAGEQKAQVCVLCHKEGPELRFTPFLDGQPTDYLVAAITAYKTGQRTQTVMNTNAASLSPTDIRDIADYFASKPLRPANEDLDPTKITAGEKVVLAMKCANCHTPTLQGTGTVPRLAGQKHRYLAWTREAFGSGSRGHPGEMPVMTGRTLKTWRTTWPRFDSSGPPPIGVHFSAFP